MAWHIFAKARLPHLLSATANAPAARPARRPRGRRRGGGRRVHLLALARARVEGRDGGGCALDVSAKIEEDQRADQRHGEPLSEVQSHGFRFRTSSYRSEKNWPENKRMNKNGGGQPNPGSVPVAAPPEEKNEWVSWLWVYGELYVSCFGISTTETQRGPHPRSARVHRTRCGNGAGMVRGWCGNGAANGAGMVRG